MDDLNHLKTLLEKVFSKCLKQVYYIYMPDFRGYMQVLMKERPCTSNMIRNSLKEMDIPVKELGNDRICIFIA